MPILPTINGSINAFANLLAELIFDSSGYFAP
jgi:hypothetical protein